MAKYKSVLVTAEILEKLGACTNGVSFFKDRFPKGIRISNSQDEMNELLASFDYNDWDLWEYLSWFINVTKGDCDLSAYAGFNAYGHEFHVWSGGAFLSDCSLLKDKK